MRLAVDAMGGDHAPDAIVRGCLDAIADLAPGDEIVLIGREPEIRDIMRECGGSRFKDAPIEIIHADQVVEMHESPVEAVRAKKESSLVKMMLLAAGRLDRPAADVVISAGNTGACVSGGTMYMKRLPGVHRPGIACAIPSFHGPMVLCDVGANPEPKPIHLAQYAVMAEAYARRVLGVQRPRVAQMNIGSEEGKGTDLVREVRDLLKAIPDLNYVGYVEGRDLFDGVADVVVTDGFVGNTMLKLAEGLSRSLFNVILSEILDRDPSMALQLEPILKDLFKKNDYHEYGGAPLLGVNGVCFICHGSSEARTIRAAIRVAREYVKKGVNEAIVERVSRLEPQGDAVATGGAA